MADPKLPRRKKSPGQWAMLEARARAEHDRFQEEMAVLASNLSQTGDPRELNKALCEHPVRFAEWAMLEARATTDHAELTANLEVLDAQLFLQYQERQGAEAGGEVQPPTPDAIQARVAQDETRRALAKEVREAKSALDQLAVTVRAMKESKNALLRLGSVWRAEMSAQPIVPRNFPPAEPDSTPAVTHTDDRSVQREKDGYLGTDNLPKFREYMDLLRRDVVLWERQHEHALVEAAFREFDNETPAESESRRETQADFRREIDEGFAQMFMQFPPGTVFRDLLIVSTPPISYEDVAARVRQLGVRLEAKFGGGHYAGLVTQITSKLRRSPVPSDRRWPSDDDRVAAADRILKKIGHVIYPIRWNWVKEALDDRAERHGTEADAELRHAHLAALYEAIEFVGEYALSQEQDVRRELRARLNDLVTIDTIGPGWRHSTEGVDIPLEETLSDERPSQAAEAEARLRLERLVDAAGLSPREREVFEIVAALGGEHGAIATAAERPGIAESTARGLRFRARKKLLAAARR